MIDLARRDGSELDASRLAEELGVPVIETVAVRKRGLQALLEALESQLDHQRAVPGDALPPSEPIDLHRRAREIAELAAVRETPVRRITHRLDAVLLHPVAGPVLLAAIMFVMFQAVFAWSAVPPTR